MRSMTARLPIVIASLLVLAACGGEPLPPLVASDILITAAMPGQEMSAGYVSLTNNTDAAISISRVVSPDFASVEIHESLLEDGIAKMRRIDQIFIPAHTTVALESGGKHLMLKRYSGAMDHVSLTFFDGDTLLLNVTAQITARKN